MKLLLAVVGALVGVLLFLLTYVLPVVMLSIFMAEAFNTPIGVITGIAYTALYAFIGFMLWKAYRGEFASRWFPGERAD